MFVVSSFAQSVPQHRYAAQAAGGTPVRFVTAKDTLRSGDSLQFIFQVRSGIGTTFSPVMIVTKTYLQTGIGAPLANDTTMDVTISESFDGVVWKRMMYVDTNQVALMLPTKSIAKGATVIQRYNGQFEDWKFGTLYIKYTFKPKVKSGFKAKIEGYFWYKQL